MKIIEWLYCSIFIFFDSITLYHPQRADLVKGLSIMYLSFFLSHSVVAMFYYVNPNLSISNPRIVGYIFILILIITYYLILVKIKHNDIISSFNSLNRRNKILIYCIVIIANVLLFIVYKEGPYTEYSTEIITK